MNTWFSESHAMRIYLSIKRAPSALSRNLLFPRPWHVVGMFVCFAMQISFFCAGDKHLKMPENTFERTRANNSLCRTDEMYANCRSLHMFWYKSINRYMRVQKYPLFWQLVKRGNNMHLQLAQQVSEVLTPYSLIVKNT